MSLEVCQIEIRVRDLDAGVRFYRDVFAWTAVPTSPSYALIDAGVPPMIGITVDARMPLGIGTYCLVDDVDAIVARIAELGGRVVIRGDSGGPFIGAVDPWGNEMFFWQRQHTPRHVGGRANPAVFCELSVEHDLLALQTYYTKLCGWSFWSPVSTMGGFAIAEGCGLAVGIGVCISKARNVTTYFEVHDLEAMLAQLGAQKIRVSPISGFPGGGRFAMFLDPDGSRVGLYEPARS